LLYVYIVSRVILVRLTSLDGIPNWAIAS
jgi:hypothetical protein